LAFEQGCNRKDLWPKGVIVVQVTDVRIRKITKEGKMKAVVSITLDDEFVIHDIKVIEGEKGLFIAMPSRRAGDGEYRDIAHPINSDTREKVQNIILEKYSAVLEGEQQ
jgi:stage V sporulation protein G